MKELIEELENNQKINKEKGLENKVDIDYILERLNNINVWFEVAKNEVITAIEDIYNDELYNGYQEKLEKISEEDINRLSWKIEDLNVWDDVYENSRDEILTMIEEEN
jgi:hypothetical protein